MAERRKGDGVGKRVARERLDGSLVGRGNFSRVNIDGEKLLELAEHRRSWVDRFTSATIIRNGRVN